MNKAIRCKKDLSNPAAFHKDSVLVNFGKNHLEVIQICILYHTRIPSHIVLHPEKNIPYWEAILSFVFSITSTQASGFIKNSPSPLST